MDLLSILGSDLSPDQIRANEAMSNGNLFREIMEADYLYEMSEAEVSEFIREPDVCEEIVNYFSLENYDAGLEGFISDLWFKFIQFIKKLIATAGVMFDHFFSGINRKKNYLHDIQIKIRGTSALNLEKFRDSRVKCYTPQDFVEVLSVVDAVEALLKKLFDDPEFNIDGNSSLQQYGYEFENGYMKQNGVGDMYSQVRFDIPIRTREDKSLGNLKWDINSYGKCLDRLLDHLKFHNEKDYLFIKFKSAMETLIRKKKQDTKVDRDEVNRLTQTAKTAMILMTFITNRINACTAQLVAMGKILESEPEKPRPTEVEW